MIFRRRNLLNELQTLVIISSIVIAMAILTIVVYVSSTKTLDTLKEQALTTASDIESLLSYPLYFVDNAQAVGIAQTFLVSRRVAGIVIHSTSGDILFTGGETEDSGRIAPISRKLTYEGLPVGSFTLFFSDSKISLTLLNHLAVSLLIVGAVVVANFLINRFIIGRIVRKSFRGIYYAMEKYSTGDEQNRIPESPYADVNRLVTHINAATERIYRHNLERQSIEQSLKKNHQYMLDIIDCLPDITFVLDNEGKVVAWNREAEILTGTKRESVIGSCNMAYSIPFFSEPQPMLLDLFDAPDEDFPDYYYYVNRSAQRLHAEAFLKNSLGQKDRYLRMSASLLHDQDGNQIGRIQTISDITDFKVAEQNRLSLEKQLQQSQKLESIGRLAGGVAHDFNNMLAVILLQTDLAQRNIEQDSIIYSRLQGIKDAAERSTQLTRQLLAFARKQDIRPQVVDLNEICGDMIKMLRRLVGEGIEIVWHPGVSLRLIKMDPSQIDQILANFTTNARDAMEGSGKIVIKTENATIDKNYISQHQNILSGKFVLLQFSDNGSGMSKEVQSKIFEPFYTTKELHKGTGLGLAMIHGIIEQNNGFIDVYSDVDFGTTFNVYLPVCEGETEPDDKEVGQEEIPPGNYELVLVVEDEVSMAEGCKTALEGLGYKVLTAGSAEEAIEIVMQCSQPIDLLMTDVVLPGMNGRELSTKILSYQPNAKTLFMSGYTADIISTKGVLDSGLNFMQKPFSIKTLADKVSRTLCS